MADQKISELTHNATPATTNKVPMATAASANEYSTLAEIAAVIGSGDSIRVNAVAPGFTRTDGTRSMWAPDDGAVAARNLPLGRLTRAEDIAAACAFLLSDDAMQITGCVLDVDGGNHLQGGGWTPMTDPTIQGRTG